MVVRTTKGIRAASTISGSISDICPYDLTVRHLDTNTYYVSTTFEYNSGGWSTSLAKPPSVQGQLGSDELVEHGS